MKHRMMHFFSVLQHRDPDSGLCALDVLKCSPIPFALISLILFLSRFIGFAAAFGAIFTPAAIITACICFFTEE